jgi:hypothetical protein
MEMQVFGVLVFPEIGGYAAPAVLCFDLGSYLAYDVQQPMNNGYVVVTQIRQRWNVNFRHDNYVDLPVGARMVKREHIDRLSHDLDGRLPAQSFITIEVVRHRFVSRCNYSKSSSRSRREWAGQKVGLQFYGTIRLPVRAQ